MNEGSEKLFQSSLENTIHYANTLNIKNIHIMAGKNESEESQLSSSSTNQLRRNSIVVGDSENYLTYFNNLVIACRKLKEFDLVALIEPINNYSLPNYYLNDYSGAIKLIKQLNSAGLDNIKLQLDIFHLQMIKGDITNTVKNVAPYIGHVQIAQAPYRNEPQVQGEIDYRYIFQLLNDIGYDGFVGLEFKPTTNTNQGLDSFLKTFNLTL